MEEGGTLYVRFDAEEPNKNPKFHAQKIYKCKYIPPTKADPFADETPAQPAAGPAVSPSKAW